MAKYSSTGTDVKNGILFAGCTINNPVFGPDPQVEGLKKQMQMVIDASLESRKEIFAELAETRRDNAVLEKENGELGKQLKKANRTLKKKG